MASADVHGSSHFLMEPACSFSGACPCPGRCQCRVSAPRCGQCCGKGCTASKFLGDRQKLPNRDRFGMITTRTRLACDNAPMRAGMGCVSLLVMGVLVVTGCAPDTSNDPAGCGFDYTPAGRAALQRDDFDSPHYLGPCVVEPDPDSYGDGPQWGD
jgi:hypothetical protein